MNPSINVSEPIVEIKECAKDMNLCVKLEGSDGIAERYLRGRETFFVQGI